VIRFARVAGTEKVDGVPDIHNLRFWVEPLLIVDVVNAGAIFEWYGKYDRLVLFEMTVPRPTSALEAAFMRATGAQRVIQAISVHSTNPDHYQNGSVSLPPFVFLVPTCWQPAGRARLGISTRNCAAVAFAVGV
jgi:hypothetical protein